MRSWRGRSGVEEEAGVEKVGEEAGVAEVGVLEEAMMVVLGS